MTIPHTPARAEATPAPDPLERRLTALTDWREGEPTLYAEALRATRAASVTNANPRRGVLARLRRPGVMIPAAAAAVLALGAAAQLWFGVSAFDRAEAPVESSPAAMQAPVKMLAEQRLGDAGADASARPAADQASPDAASAERSVIHKATIEILSKDVRADFSRASLLVSEARGEFVESSSLIGEGPAAHATLTLRVATDRLSEVLNDLRALGAVVTENSSGDDVTEQVVDLAARVRNEQKVEEELLKLLETRKGAPLKEILELRDQVAKVRERIEQMTAQQERTGRSVSLATILVILRPEVSAPVDAEESKHESAFDYFAHKLAVAWRAGTRSLADSAAGLVQALVGGLVWWSLLAAGVIAGLRWMRATRRNAAHELAPAL